jgi:integrase/uncharacterized coiled-coil protein SlyX
MQQINHVELWLNKKCESSQTREGYSFAWKKFEDFCTGMGYNSTDVVTNWRSIKLATRNRDQKIEKFKDELKDVIESYRSHLKTEKITPLSLKWYLSALQSFLSSSDIPVRIDLPKRAFVQYHNRDITKEEIRSIVEHVHSIRDKCFFILMAESGMRPDTLCRLQFKHFKQDFQNHTTPMKVELPSEILKYKVSDRFTFIGEDGIKTLREYLKPLLPLSDEDYIFRPRRKGRGEQDLEGQATPTAFSTAFNRAVQKLKLSESIGRGKPKAIRLYNLRKYFRNNLRSVDSGFINFWMGHTDNADMHYVSMNAEEHRRRYSEGYQSLRIFEPSESGQMKIMEKQLTDANKTIEELKQQIKQKDENMTDLQRSLTSLEDRVKPMEEFWKDIQGIRNSKVIKHPDGTLELKTEETDTQSES